MEKEDVFSKTWIVIFLAFASSVMLFGATGDHPYGYYQILRWLVTVSAAYSAYYYYLNSKNYWMYTFVATAILFNPIAPIYLDRSIWRPIDIGVAILFISSVVYMRVVQRRRNDYS